MLITRRPGVMGHPEKGTLCSCWNDEAALCVLIRSLRYVIKYKKATSKKRKKNVPKALLRV